MIESIYVRSFNAHCVYVLNT